MVTITKELLKSGQNKRGLYNIKQLRMLGLKGLDFAYNWKETIIGKPLTDYQSEMFVKLKD
jgi:hypothetical protein